jgi:hypothetical protein
MEINFTNPQRGYRIANLVLTVTFDALATLRPSLGGGSLGVDCGKRLPTRRQRIRLYSVNPYNPLQTLRFCRSRPPDELLTWSAICFTSDPSETAERANEGRHFSRGRGFQVE